MKEDVQALREQRQRLEDERLRIQDDISNYPAPIPACDAYFNHLLERRAAVCEELTRIDAALTSHAAKSA